jgi:hypothetical protein
MFQSTLFGRVSVVAVEVPIGRARLDTFVEGRCLQGRSTVAGTRSGSRKRRELDSPDPVGEFWQQVVVRARGRGASCRSLRRRVTRRWAAVRSRIASNSASRPISSETGSGRFVGRRGGTGTGTAVCKRLRRRARPDRSNLPGKLAASSGDRGELTAMRHDPEAGELDARRPCYREIHSRGLQGHFRGSGFFSRVRRTSAEQASLVNSSHYLRKT